MDSKYTSISKSVQKTNELLNEIQKHFGWEDRPEQAYAALRAVLQTLRDRLPTNEALDLAAQLPFVIRGMYFDGWKPQNGPKKMHWHDFLDEVQTRFRYEVGTEELVHGVLISLRRFLSKGEMKDISEVLPRDISKMLF